MAEPQISGSDALLRADDVARRLNVPKPTLYEWSRKDPARYGLVRIGRRTVRFRRDVIDRLVTGDSHHEGA